MRITKRALAVLLSCCVSCSAPAHSNALATLIETVGTQTVTPDDSLQAFVGALKLHAALFSTPASFALCGVSQAVRDSTQRILTEHGTRTIALTTTCHGNENSFAVKGEDAAALRRVTARHDTAFVVFDVVTHNKTTLTETIATLLDRAGKWRTGVSLTVSGVGQLD